MIGRGFVYGALISVAVLFVSHIFIYTKSKREDQREAIRFFSIPLLIPFAFLGAGLVSLMLNIFLVGGSGYGLLFNIRVVAVMILLFGLLAASQLVFGSENNSGSLRSYILHFYPQLVYQIIASVLTISVFASILLPREASLSCLWKEDPKGEIFEANAVGTQSETEPQQWTLQGGFLSRREGAWYVLTEANRLQAIPEDSSTRVVGGQVSDLL